MNNDHSFVNNSNHANGKNARTSCIAIRLYTEFNYTQSIHFNDLLGGGGGGQKDLAQICFST